MFANEGKPNMLPGECDTFCDSQMNGERIKFWNLVRKIEKELEDIQLHTRSLGKPIDVMEVFRSLDSSLTHQVEMQKGRSIRFGISQGDLQSSEGRRSLFESLCRHKPKHVWMSPECGPWPKWSNFNSQRSLEARDRIHQERTTKLVQVALCLVICRHQRRHHRHAHWEQLKGSNMFALPYLQELFQYMLSAFPDMCTSGNFLDPDTQLLIQKGMHILTTSQALYNALKDLRCDRSHEHQAIEGTTHVHGRPMLRSRFSKRYPRKFSRLVAQALLKKSFSGDMPIGSLVDPVLMALNAVSSSEQTLTASDQSAKRPKVLQPRYAKASSADRSLDNQEPQKRRKLQPSEISSQTPSDVTFLSQLENIMNEIETSLPRVGKQFIQQNNIVNMIQSLFPDKVIKGIVACKGTERTLGPPENISPKEAPFRRAIMKSRGSGKVTVQSDWEKYDCLAKRQVIRKLQPCRVKITVFAGNPAKPSMNANPLPSQEIDEQEPSRPDVPSQPQEPASKEAPQCPPDICQIQNAEQQEFEQPSRNFESQMVKRDAESETLMEPFHSSTPGKRFMALSKEEQMMLRRAHQNICHPSPNQLSAALRNQGARSDRTQAVFDMPCEVCAFKQQPKIARPCTIKHELGFSDKVCKDEITWTNQQGKTFHFYHLIDQATNYDATVPPKMPLNAYWRLGSNGQGRQICL